jgi:hypothetical protein
LRSAVTPDQLDITHIPYIIAPDFFDFSLAGNLLKDVSITKSTENAKMLVAAGIRILSILIVIAASRLTGSSAMLFAATVATALAHLILSVVYSRKQLAGIRGDKRSTWLLIAGVPASMGMYFGGYSMGLYFAIHHVFNEVYSVRNSADVVDGGNLRLWRLIMASFVVATAMRTYEAIQSVDARLLFAGLAISYLVYLVKLINRRSHIGGFTGVLGAMGFECIGLGAVAISLVAQINIIHLAFYHFVFWSIYPIVGLMKKSALAPLRFVAANVVLSVLFWGISPFGYAPWRFEISQWVVIFQFFTFIHITSAFSLSAAHPQWIRRIFQPLEPVLASAAAAVAPQRDMLLAGR